MSVEEELISAIYPVLQEKARHIRHRHGGYLTLNTTEIAHEAYLHLADLKHLTFNDRTHFQAIAARVVRQLVIDYVRKRTSLKRGGKDDPVSFEDIEQAGTSPHENPVDWLAMDEAMRQLEEADPLCARVVELKLFSGLTGEEIAAICGCAEITVRRKWRFGQALLISHKC